MMTTKDAGNVDGYQEAVAVERHYRLSRKQLQVRTLVKELDLEQCY